MSENSSSLACILQSVSLSGFDSRMDKIFPFRPDNVGPVESSSSAAKKWSLSKTKAARMKEEIQKKLDWL